MKYLSTHGLCGGSCQSAEYQWLVLQGAGLRRRVPCITYSSPTRGMWLKCPIWPWGDPELGLHPFQKYRSIYPIHRVLVLLLQVHTWGNRNAWAMQSRGCDREEYSRLGLCPALSPCPSLWMTSPPCTEVSPGSAAIQLPLVMHMCPLDSLLENLTPSLRVAHTHPYPYTCKQHDTALTQSRPMIMAKKHESFSPLLCFSGLKERCRSCCGMGAG